MHASLKITEIYPWYFRPNITCTHWKILFFSCAKKNGAALVVPRRVGFFQGNRCGCSSSKRLTDDVRRLTTDSGDCISFKLYKSQVLSAIWPQTHCYSRKGITNHSSSSFPCPMCKNAFLLKLASKSERICHWQNVKNTTVFITHVWKCVLLILRSLKACCRDRL